MSSDDDIKKIARFLETGGTMLANHCDICGAPLFRFKGEIICPLCSGADTDEPSKSVSEKSTPVFCSATLPAQKSPSPKVIQKQQQRQNRDDDYVVGERVYSAAENRLRELILLKITIIAEDVQNESDPRRIAECFDLIEKGLDMIGRLY
ncbi:Sjogren's syndrome/scleroderma autoantigen 1 family protein [Methanolapillus millepedarum]|uniref:Sjogrens syndrome scleroderma autoantigen 1 n=1 Tax=Methanolapillus millepedarum TaxID=3028296 RepID=A0AA96VC34_9EURY|nr:hypothetical protein MsAc7_10230 [Methanosarcinaceae archaeon Ac7]